MPQDADRRAEYAKGWKLTEIMPVNSVGIVTARDALTIHWTAEDVWKTVNDFVSLPPEEAREKYRLGPDSQDWKVKWAQKDLQTIGPIKTSMVPILYRPFDVRCTYYTGKPSGFHCRPRGEVMQHMIAGKNIGIIASKQTRDHWNVFASRHIIGHKAVAAYDINSMFPLYIYPDDVPRDSLFVGACNSNHCVNNLAAAFITDFTARLGMTFIPNGKGDRIQTFGPEDVFDYMYAVFHSPAYRDRYAEFLKIDFPRLPLTSNIELFRSLCEIGGRLVALHLMKTASPLVTSYQIAGNNTVEAVRYSAPGEGSEMGRVWINKTQYFEGVPPEVWVFQIGGYQVCQKWLKDRKGRSLTYDDMTHYQRIVAVLAETIRQMAAVDETIAARGGLPIV